MNELRERIRYDANVCCSDFSHVRERFDAWKRESPACRPERRLFVGKDARRANRTMLSMGGSKCAAGAMRAVRSVRACVQLAAEGRTMWLVMAACDG